jgi:hypothetical protein
MALGNFLGGLTQGFGRARIAAQEQQRKDKMAKLQGQLVELQLKDAQTRDQARAQIREALSGGQGGAVPAPDGPQGPGVGIPGQGAPQAPQSLLDRLSDGSLTGSLLDLGMDPTRLVQMQQQREQAAQTSALFERFAPGGGAGEGGGGPTTQGGVPGLGGGAAGGPAGGLPGGLSLQSMNIGGKEGPSLTLGRERTPTVISALTLAGIDPKSPEGRAIVKRNLAGEDIRGQLAHMQALRLNIETQQKQLNLEVARAAQQGGQRTERIAAQKLGSDIRVQLSGAREMVQIIRDLEGTYAETGAGAALRTTALSGIALAGDTLGLDVEEQKELTTKAQRFQQLARKLAVDNFAAFAKDIGQVSDTKFQALVDNDVSPNKTIGANALALADRIEAVLEAADRNEVSVSDRNELARLAQDLRGSERVDASTFPGGGQLPQPEVPLPPGFRVVKP